MAMAMAGPAGQAGSFRIPETAPATPDTVLSSAAIRSAADAIASAYQAMPEATDYSAAPDLASGLVLAQGDSLGGASFGSLASLHLVDPTPGSLFDPIHLLG
jgi:hypothetical protein